MDWLFLIAALIAGYYLDKYSESSNLGKSISTGLILGAIAAFFPALFFSNSQYNGNSYEMPIILLFFGIGFWWGFKPLSKNSEE